MQQVLWICRILFFCITIGYPGLAQTNGRPAKPAARPVGKSARPKAVKPEHTFTRADSLRGYLSPLRSCYDVFFYHLNIRVNTKDSTIGGYNILAYRAEKDFKTFQIDLYQNMEISAITHRGKPLAFQREHQAVFVSFNETQTKGTLDSIVIHYSGKPHVAKNPPWDGGFVWTKDKVGKPWVTVACEGDGASLWWPCKDHLSDEPDSMYISVDVPNDLQCISNGNLKKMAYLKGGYSRFDWRVHYPINTYNVTLNIGNYEQMNEIYTAADGKRMALDYYIMPYSRGKAEKQFKQVKPMLKVYEKYFGKYPFWDDGYALVETPYLGMEHQSAIAYGNDYLPGYKGKDLSGVGLTFDYIIIHETAHEYWGNNISMADHGEMWISESFCTYAESIYVEEIYGKETALKYLQGQSRLIQNTEPMIGPLDVNFEKYKTTDIYFKGANMLHTLRNVIDNDSVWFGILKGLQQDFRLKQVHSQDITNYITQKSGKNLTAFFEQYLRQLSPPTLSCVLTQITKKEVELRVKWTADAKGFAMPVKIAVEKDKEEKPIYQTIEPTSEWQVLTLPGKVEDFKVATELFYILTDIQGKSAEAK